MAKGKPRRITQDDLDKKAYGSRPVYHDMVSLLDTDPRTRKFELVKGLNYHSALFNSKSAALEVQKWLKTQKHFKITSKQIQKVAANFSKFCPTFHSLMQMENDGWVLSQQELSQLQQHIVDLYNNDNTHKEEVQQTQKNQVKKESPRKMMEKQLDENIIGEIEGLCDTWLFNSSKNNEATEFDLKKLFAEKELNPSNPALTYIQKLVIDRLSEYTEVLRVASITKQNEESLSEEDLQLREGYNTLTKVQLRRIIKNLEMLRDSIELMKTKKVRTPSKTSKVSTPKIINVEKALKTFKYQKESNEFKVKSFDPSNIFGRSCVVLFNTKYRKITVIHAVAGETLNIKGSTFQNVDDTRSYTQTLRKPENDLVQLVSAKSIKQIETIMSNLSTKRSTTVSGRSNEATIILNIL